jgi:hypothetical protein
MTNDDIRKASLALIDWVDSQDLDAEEAVPVLVHALASFVYAIAETRGADVKVGLDVAAEMVRNSKPEGKH